MASALIKTADNARATGYVSHELSKMKSGIIPRPSRSLIFVLAALLSSVAGNSIICWHSWQFYVGVSALPPGSEIRLIGRGMDTLLVSSVTFLVASPLSVAGIIYSIKQQCVSTGLVSVIALGLALTPLPLAAWLDGKIIADTGIALAP